MFNGRVHDSRTYYATSHRRCNRRIPNLPTVLVWSTALSLASGLCQGQIARVSEDFGPTAVGTVSVPRSIAYHLTGLSAAPYVFASGAADFGITGKMTCSDPNNCAVAVTFSPHVPGLRQGSVLVKDSVSNALLAVTPLVGTGVAPQTSIMPGAISTIAGAGNGLKAPVSVAVDPLGNLILGDASANMVFKYTMATGQLSIVAGKGTPGYGGDGQRATAATLNGPAGVALDNAGNVYIADTGNNVIRMVDANTQVITTVAGGGSNYGKDGLGDGGLATGASLTSPTAVAVDRTGNVYISDTGNNLVRKIDTAGIISIVAGSGPAVVSTPGIDGLGDAGSATTAILAKPAGLAVDIAGTHLYIADANDNLIRVVDLTKNQIGVSAGMAGGPAGFQGDGARATSASLNAPKAVALDPAGNLYIADSKNHVVRRVDVISGIITTVTGTQNGVASAPSGLALDSAGALFIADLGNAIIQRVTMGGQSYHLPDTVIGHLSSTQTVTVVNTGNADLAIANINFPANVVQKVSGNGNDCSGAVTLHPGANCQILFAFAPTTAGNISASLVVHDNSINNPNSSQVVSIFGSGLLASSGGIISTAGAATMTTAPSDSSAGPLSATSVNFGNQPQWTSGTPQTVTFSNPSSVPDVIRSIRVTGTNASDFNQVNTCGSTVPVGSTCTISLTFTPSTGSTESASLVIDSTDSGGPYTVALNGVGVSGGAWPFGALRTVTVLHTQVPNSDQTNFPVLVSGVFPWLASTTNGGSVRNNAGYDIVFTADSSGIQKLTWEVEKYDPVSGQLVAWVQLPTVSHTSDTAFYIWYGNPAITADQSNTLSTWDSNFSGVWHLGDGTVFSGAESSSNANAALNSGAAAIAGKVYGGGGFDGKSAYLQVADASGLDLDRTDSFTFEFWMNSNQTTNGVMLEKLDATETGYQVALVGGNLDYYLAHDAANSNNLSVHSSFPVNDGKWHHVVLTYNGISSTNGVAMYIDGSRNSFVVNRNNLTGSIANSDPLDFGRRRFSNGIYFNGLLDEVRISKGIVRTADWVKTEYNNQNSPDAFVTLGAETLPAQASLNPATMDFGSQAIATRSPSQNVALSNPGTVPLIVNSISFTGSNAADFAQTNNCGPVLLPGAGCTISVSFTPSLAGSEMASLSIASSASAVPQTAALSGRGCVPTPAGLLSATAVDFGNQAQWTSTTKTLTFSNPGTAPNPIASIGLTGPNASDFKQSNTCGASVPVQGSCTITVTFTPSTNGAESASMIINSADSASPYAITLGGGGLGGGWRFGFQRTLSVIHTQVSNSDQTNFPVLVSGTFPWLASVSNGGGVQSAAGYDIVFTADAAGNQKLNWEVEKYDPVTGQFIAWVQLPTVSYTADTPFFIWYGNGNITSDQSNKQGAWDAFFSGVWHLAGPQSAGDSSSYAETGTNNGSAVLAGKIGDGAGFNGIKSYIEVGDASALDLDRTDSFTFEFWMNSNQKTNGVMLEKLSVTQSGYQVALVNSYLDYYLCHDYASRNNLSVHSNVPVNDGKWHHVVVTYNGTSTTNGMTMYLDGSSNAFVINRSNLSAGFGNANSLDFGRRRFSNDIYYNGLLDEIRISKGIVRSADWVKTEYNNQNSPAGFISIGAEVTPPQAVLSAASLSFGSQVVATTSPSQAVTLSNPGGMPLALGGITITGPTAADFVQSNDCGPILAPGASCTITVNFTPSSAVAETPAISIVDSANGSPHVVSLSGTGQNPITPGLKASSGSMVVNTSATYAQISGTVTLTSNRPVNWSLVSGSSGTLNVLNSTHALYTAPASIQNQNVLAGCPVLPNDSVFNTRIDNLPVHPSSGNWTSAANTGTNGVGFDVSWGTSVADNTTPLTNESFYYTAGYNGPWLLPSLPNLKRENGSYVTDQNGSDHHILAVNKDTCQFWEVYNNYLTPRQANGKTYTATSGYSYNGLSYSLPNGGSTDAAGLPLGPLTLHLDEVEAGAIHHAVRFTLSGGYIFGDAKTAFWPATEPHFATCCTNSPPYGARFRLKAGFDISKFSPKAQAILTALKQYGMILADAGTGPTITVDMDLSRDPSALGALGQISQAHITLANFEAVDESSLKLSARSSQVNPNNGYVQPAAFAVVNATDQSNSSNQINYPVVLQGVNIALPEPILYIVAGNYSYQLKWWVNGSANQNVTWSLVSGPGSVTPGGVYTPPPSVTNPVSATLQAVSSADPNATVLEPIYIVPTGDDGAIRINSGGGKATDRYGKVWASDQGFEAGDYVRLGGDYPGWPAQSNPEIGIYQSTGYTYGSDIEYRFVVPNGNYKVRFMLGQPYNGAPSSGCTFGAKLHAPFMIDVQGQTAAHNYDFGKSINYACATPVDIYVPAQVTDNTLTAALRVVVPDTQRGSSSPLINGFEIIPDSTAPYIAIDAQQQTMVNPGGALQLYATGWYMDNTVTWSLSGPGTISSTGMYTAPAVAPASPETVTITATSTADPSITAAATLTIP